MMIKADVFVANKNWKKYIKFPAIYINKKLKKVDKNLNIFKKNNLKFSILLSGNSEIKKLNSKFRKKIKRQIFCHFHFTKKRH